MAAYWKSPYKEPSYFTSSTGNTSTRRYEKSLPLTRAKSSILTCNSDWPTLTSSKRPGSSNQLYKSTNGILKGILKKNKVKLSPRLQRGTEDCHETIDNKSEGEGIVPQRTSKRVSFGPNEDVGDGNESDFNVSNPCGHSVTLQRLKHSRKVEETAMQKLNKLISGLHTNHASGTNANSTFHRQVNSHKWSSSKVSLPVVDGKGLLTPRSVKESPKYKYQPETDDDECSNVNKDEETGEVIITSQLQEDSVCNEYALLFDNSSTNPAISADDLKKPPDEDPSPYTTKVALPFTFLETPINTELSHEKVTPTPRRRIISRRPNPVSFQNKKFHAKLLPGRYPFNTGAIHIRNASSKKHVNTNTHSKRRHSVKTNNATLAVVQNESTNEEKKISDDVILEADNQLESSTSVELDPNLNNEEYQKCELLPDRPQNVTMSKPKGESREPRYTDKTSQILTWLRDVRQKQNFQPRETRYIIIDS